MNQEYSQASEMDADQWDAEWREIQKGKQAARNIRYLLDNPEELLPEEAA